MTTEEGNRGWATTTSQARPFSTVPSSYLTTGRAEGRLDSSPFEWTEMSMLRDGWKGWGHPPPTPDPFQLLLILSSPASTLAFLWALTAP